MLSSNVQLRILNDYQIEYTLIHSWKQHKLSFMETTYLDDNKLKVRVFKL